LEIFEAEKEVMARGTLTYGVDLRWAPSSICAT